MIAFVKNNIKLCLVLLVLTGLVYYFFTRDITIGVKDTSNPHYVNNLYLSNDQAYKNLDEDTQYLYDVILKALKRKESKVVMSSDEFDCSEYESCSALLQELYDSIAIDQPALTNFSSFSAYSNGNEVTIKLRTATPLKFVSEIGMLRIERIIDEIKRKTKNMTDAEKVLYVYEWMGDYATYDRMFTFASRNQSIYSVFLQHNAVCAGFSKTATVIFQNIGIEAYSVTGFMDASDGIGHMWNIIKLDDKYYFFDSTWSASRNNKSAEDYYFGLIPIEMNGYVMDHPDWYPPVSFDPLPGVLN